MGMGSSAFTLALVVGCLYGFNACAHETPEKRAQREAKEAATLDSLQRTDANLFAKAGFSIVSRTGAGSCSDGDLGRPGYLGPVTDIAYVLAKAGNNVSYKACVVHGNGTAITDLTSIERAGPKP